MADKGGVNMDLKAPANARFSVLKNGLLLTFVLATIFYLFHWVWGFVLSLGPNPFQMAWANFVCKVAIFFVMAYLIGLAFETNWFKKIILGFLGSLPLVGVLVQSLNHFERIKREGIPEVKFELVSGSGIWLKGWVSKEWKDEKTEEMICGVVLPMFVHPIGAYVCVEKKRLVYTGRNGLDNIADNLSGGLIGRK
ncbi:MAG: hypothetical protein Q7S81_02930 [bacterium]|nr:hypothetical protein [bacterium]